MIKVLTSWRGIFAVCIVCFHFGMHEFDQMILAGVSFFFMTSGFLSAMRYEDKSFSIKWFYTRRLFRIFPLHWLALALMILLDLSRIHHFSYGWDLPLHVALLQSWVPVVDVYYGYSIHSWFLSSLLTCIVLTPLIMRWTRKSSLTLIWIVILIAAIILISFDLMCGTSHLQQELNYTYVCPLTRLIDYMIGIALYTTIKRLNWREKMQHISVANSSLLELATLAMLAFFITLHATGGDTYQAIGQAPLWWIPCALLIVSATVLNGNEGIFGKLFTIKPLLWLGGISFEIYILQKFVNNAFNHFIAPFFGHYGILIYDYSFAVTLPLLLIIAFLVNKWYTKPISQLAR